MYSVRYWVPWTLVKIIGQQKQLEKFEYVVYFEIQGSAHWKIFDKGYIYPL